MNISDVYPSWQDLPPEWVQRCWEFAGRVIDSYAAGKKPRSLAIDQAHSEETGELPASRDIVKQANARAAEVAVCLELGLDPETALNWGDKCDVGFDLIVPYNGTDLKVDVKNSPHGDLLLWPKKKNHFYKETPFDVLCFVNARLEFNRGEYKTRYVIGKWRFYKTKRIAGPDDKLQDGTWFVDRGTPFGEFKQKVMP